MKKKLTHLLFCLVAFSFFGTLNAQTDSIYQLPNSGFEEWYMDSGGTNGSSGLCPVGFNSYHSAYCSTGLLGTCQGVTQRCERVTDTRPGSEGEYSLRIFSNSVIGVRANGNVTTGRIYMGSMTANNAANYNYADYTLTPPKFIQEITGTPDSLRFWVKYLPGRTGNTNTTDQGRIRVYIHGTGECRDAPQYPSGMTETQLYYGKAMKNFYKEDGDWQSYTVPFEYTGTNIQRNEEGNYYVLLSMTTNAAPGGGANSADQVWFDDIEFIYSAWLTDLKVLGQTIEGFQKNLLIYGGPKLTGYGPYEFPYQPEDFSWTTEVDDVLSVVVTNVPGPDGDANGGYTSILITAEDKVTQIEYRVYYFVHLSDDNTLTALSYTIDGETPIPVPGFSPLQTNYSILLTDPEEVRIPQIIVESIVLSDTTAQIQNIIQPIGVNSKGTVIVRAENFLLRTYDLLFSKTLSSNSKLNWIKISNVDIPDFDPDIFEYDFNITNCATSIPTVTYEKSSTWANVLYTPATMTTKTATILVTAEDGAQTTYTINFTLTNSDVSFTYFRFGTSSTNQITPIAGETVYERAFSFTAAQTINLTLSCAAATFTRTPTSTAYYPDTNYFHVTAQDGFTTTTYKIVLKNTNCFVATGNNSGFRYNYNGLINQNTSINLSTGTNGGNNNNNLFTTSVVTLPVGPNVPPELVVFGLATSIAPPTYTIVQPTSRTDTAIVTLTANDGVTQKIYRVPFRPTLSTDASLMDITYNGTSIPAFEPNTLTYTVWLPANITQVPEIIGIPTFQWLPAGNIVVTPAEDLLGTTIISVTAENGNVTRTYSVNFDVEPIDNAYLSVIVYDGNVVSGFKPTTFSYNVEIPYSTSCPNVVGIPMAAGANVFHETSNTPPCTTKILVISENLMGMKIYTVNFTMVKNTDATLTDIKINGVSLDVFNPQIFDYEYLLPYTDLEAPVVTATTAYAHATAVVTQINEVTGTVIINVTAEDEDYSQIYTINFARELSPVTAIETIEYDYDDQFYTYNVNENETEITIILPVETIGEPIITNILLADNRSVFVIEEQPDEANNFTGIVTVTAEDFSEEIYTIAFERTLSASTLLTGIYYNNILVPDFDPDVLNYEVMLPYNTAQIQTVTANSAWINTEVIIDQANNPFGQATVTVTSEDAQHIKIYTVVFLRKGDVHLVDLSYNLDGVTIPVPGFVPSILEYDVTLDMATTAVPELEYVLEDYRCSVEIYPQSTPNGTSQLKIISWTQDDSLTYTVNFTVLISTQAILSDLLVDGVTIESFAPNKFNYSFPEFPYGKEDFPVVTAVAEFPDAEVVVVNIDDFPGTATVTVTAGNTTIISVYSIYFSVDPGNNTYLKDLLIEGSSWSEFQKEVFFYTVVLPFGTTILPTIEGIAEDDNSSITLIEALNFGDTAKIVVTALNGDFAIYYVYFPEPKNNNAYASMIYIDWEQLDGFVRYKSTYEYFLPHNYTGKPFISVELEDVKASLGEIIWTGINPLVAEIPITAEDGSKFSYFINFERDVAIIIYNDETEIQVYPNPSSDIIHFEMNEKNQASVLEIYSVEGKKIINSILQSGINTLNITHLQKGIYFYKIFTDQTMLGAGKFVKN